MGRDTFIDGCMAVGLFAVANMLTLDASAFYEGVAVLGGIIVCVLLRSSEMFRNGEKPKKLKKVDANSPGTRANTSPKKEAVNGLHESRSNKKSVQSDHNTGDDDAYEMGATNVIITAIRRGRIWELPKLLDDALERAASEHSDSQEEQRAQIQTCLLTVLRTCSVAHQHQAALTAYDHVLSQSPKYPAVQDVGSSVLWSVLLYNAVECKEYRRAVEFYDCLCQQGNPCNHDFVNVVHALAAMKTQARFDQLMLEVESSDMNFDAQTRTRALGVCCAQGAFEMAEVLMTSKVFSEELNEMNFNTIMRGYGRKGQFKKCKALFEQMKAHKCEATQMTYGILLEAGVSSKDYAGVRAVFRDFVDSGLKPNAIHYTTLIKAIVHDGSLQEVDELLELMERTPSATPDLITYQLAMRAHAEKGDLEGTVRLLKHVISLKMKPDAVMYECVLSSCCADGVQAFRAMSVFDDLVSCGMVPNQAAFSKLLRALCHGKSWSLALEFLQSIKTRFGAVPEAWLFAQLGLSCVRGGDLGMAVVVHTALLQAHGGKVTRQGPGCCASARLLACCVGRGDLQAAKALAFDGPSKPAKASTSSAQGDARGGHSKRLEVFFEVNRIDDRCRRLLMQLEPGQADWVMDQEFVIKVDEAKGTASAKVVSFVRRSKTANVSWDFYPGREDLRKKRLFAFLELNNLTRNEPVVKALHNLTDDALRKLMDEHFLVEPLPGQSASETVMSLAGQVKFLRDLPSGDEVFGAMLSEYIALNRIDDRCALSLRSLSRADAAWIMDQEFKIEVDLSRGTASAKVIGLVNRVRSGELRY